MSSAKTHNKNMTYSVKVPDHTSSSKSIADIMTINVTKKIMEMTGTTEFTKDGHVSLVRMSSDFTSKILVTAVTYMGHNRRFEILVEDICQSLDYHNLKFYGIGEMCMINDTEHHPTELLTEELVHSRFTGEEIPGSYHQKTNLIENFEKRGGWDTDEINYESDDIVDDDNESTTSSNLNTKHWSHEKTVEESNRETKMELQEAQEILDMMEDDELGQTDDEEAPYEISNWSNDDDCYFLAQSRTFPKSTDKVFARTTFKGMCKALWPKCYGGHLSPAALSIFHQVFENKLLEQCANENSSLRNEIRCKVLEWRTNKLEKENGVLKEEKNELQKENDNIKEEMKSLKQDREKVRKISQCLEGHFNVTDLTHVSP